MSSYIHKGITYYSYIKINSSHSYTYTYSYIATHIQLTTLPSGEELLHVPPKKTNNNNKVIAPS